MTPAIEKPYAGAFAEFIKTARGFRALREAAIGRFAEIGFPTTHQEDWRFTSVAPVARTAFEPAPRRAVSAADVERLAPAWGPRLVFVNGRYAPELSAPGKLEAGSLAGAAPAQLGRYAAFDDHAFIALNTAFFEDGAWVRIPRNTVVEEPVHLVFLAACGGRPAVSHPRTLIVAEENTQATFVETYAALEAGLYFTNAVTEIAAGENAVIDHYKVQMEGPEALHFGAMHVAVGRAANFSSHSIALGGAWVRNEPVAVLSEGAEVTLNGLYLAGGNQHIDNHTVIDHAQPHGASHELYKGILDGHASAVFNGRIFVRKDAQKTDARQTNKNLVLSEDAVINTKPELQIWADDVRCTHGATIGQMDAEGLFYLQSRGIGRLEARDMLTYAFARDVIDRIQLAALRERLEKVLFERLHDNGR